jgi:hypothetical protein
MKERQKPVRPSHAGESCNELLTQLDIEVNRLPEKYRVAIIFCELEGKTRKEAARMLGLSEGTLSWRLAQARKMLARKLAPYAGGISTGAVLALAHESTRAAVPFNLMKSTLKAALQLATGKALEAGLISTQAILLSEGVIRTMLLSKLKLVGVAVLVLVLGTGSIGMHYHAGAAEPNQPGIVARTGRSDEIDELRLEIAALRTGMQALRDRVKTLEAHQSWCPGTGLKANADCQKCHTAQTAVPIQLWHKKADALQLWLTVPDAQSDADAALGTLRANPDDKDAAAKLIRALKALKEAQKVPAKESQAPQSPVRP